MFTGICPHRAATLSCWIIKAFATAQKPLNAVQFEQECLRTNMFPTIMTPDKIQEQR